MYIGMGDASGSYPSQAVQAITPATADASSSGGTSSAIPTSTAPQIWFSIGGSADQWGDLTATDQANWLASAQLAYAAGASPSLPAVSDAQAAAAGAKQSGTSSTGTVASSTTPLGIPLWGWAAAAGAVVLLFLTKGK